jgi:hypothetical protein
LTDRICNSKCFIDHIFTSHAVSPVFTTLRAQFVLRYIPFQEVELNVPSNRDQSPYRYLISQSGGYDREKPKCECDHRNIIVHK